MLLDEVKKNKVKTFSIVSFFFLFMSLVVYFAVLYFSKGSFIAVPIAFSFAFFATFFSYYNSDKIVLKINKARPATEEEDRELRNILEALVIAAEIKMPKLYIMEEDAMNAFATGRDKNHAVICVTTGLLKKLDKYEIEGVLAHEISHIKNYDTLLQTIVTIMVGFVVIISDWVLRSTFYRRRNNEQGNNTILLFIGIFFMLLAPLFANLMKLALSRNREYLADATAVEITRNNKGLINALEKISSQNTKITKANKSTSHLFIINPFSKQKDSLFSTHPSTFNRIEKLKNIN